MKVLLFLVALALMPRLAMAQGFEWEYSVRTPVAPPRAFVGVEVATGLTTHSGTLTYSELVPCCEFAGSQGTPLWLGIGAEYWLDDERAVWGSLGYRSITGDFSSNQSSFPLADGRALVTHYEYDVSISYVGLQGGLRQRLFQSHASVSFGLRAQALASSSATLEEVVDGPADYFFTTNPPSKVKRIQNARSVADIEPLYLAFLVGGSYDISLYRGGFISPTIMVAVPLTTTSAMSNWRSLDLTLGVRFMQAL
ncbi:MAG: hypothetical protein MUC47_07665 [Candidatus Kapabacteria bacterium]|jgi:hypothetical protein|nr:hypothetical protein [Candidatus Kapabacteria bacterium]